MRLRLLGADHASVQVGARSMPVRRRQAEILALLCLRPEGLTTEQLRAGLYGDGGSN